MKLLLTSAGFTNETISNVLLEMAGRPFKDLKLTFIPTAANVEPGGKEWLIEDYANCKQLGFAQVDIVDISALPKEIWLPRLEEADILFVGGGNSFHLMNWIAKSGLEKVLSKMLETKIYVGLSAGSMVTCKWNSTCLDTYFYDEKSENVDKYNSLGLVDFFIFPHLNSEMFPKVNLEEIGKFANQIPEAVYALDDGSAVVVDGNKISVISEGKWKKFN